MLKISANQDWGIDARVNNAGDIELMLYAMKLDIDDNVEFKKLAVASIIQPIIQNSEELTPEQKTTILEMLANMRGVLLGN